MNNKCVLKILIVLIILLSGCRPFPGNNWDVSVTVLKKKELPATLNSVNVANNQMTINGSGFSKVTTVQIQGNGVTTNLNINSYSDTKIVVTAASALSLLVNGTFNLIIGNVEAQVTYPITFTFQNGAVQAVHLAQMGASSGQVLKWNSATSSWVPSTLANSQVYLGGWNASTNSTSNSSALSDTTAPPSGEYYIVTTAGTQNLGLGSVNYFVGDWVMSNGTSWEKITGSLSGAGTTNFVPYYTSSSTLANSPLAVSGSNIGIGKTNPGSALDVKGTLKLSGASSGYVGFSPAVDAGSTIYTLPITQGTPGQVLATDGVSSTPTLTWITPTASVGTVTGVTSANTDIAVAGTSAIPSLTLNSGTNAGQVLKLSVSSQLPALDGSLLTQLNPANFSAPVALNKGGTGSVTQNFVDLTTNQTIAGVKTFSSTIAGSINGNAATVTTNANLTGDVTSSGSNATTVKGINGILVSGLATGILKNTTTTGVPSIAVAGTDYLIPTGIASALTNTTINTTGITFANHALASGDALSLLFNKLAFDQSDYVSKSANQTISGSLQINSLTGFIEVPTPLTAPEAANKGYVDGLLGKSGAVTTASTGSLISNTATSSNASINKIGLDIESTGAWTGSPAVNTALVVNATGGTTNYAATFMGGNVGIGTTTPSSPFHVVATGSSEGIRVQRSGVSSQYISLNENDGSAHVIYAFGDKPLRFKNESTGYGMEFYVNSGGTNAMTILPSGNVGIGTTTPGKALDVVGGIRTSDYFYTTGNARIKSDSTYFGVTLSSADDVWWMNNTEMYCATDNSMSLGKSANRYKDLWLGNNAYIAGNVGIGTTLPVAKLNISGTDTAAKLFRIDMPAGQTSHAIFLADSTGTEKFSVLSNGSVVTMSNFIGNGFIDPTTNLQGWMVSNTEARAMTAGLTRMTVTNAGNVGIGTTNPGSKLQVAGDITPTVTATNTLGTSALRWNYVYLSNAPDVSSDVRLKKDIQNTDLGLDFINSLRPVSWLWIDKNQDTSRHYGIIAQEAEAAIARAKFKSNQTDDSRNVIVTHDLEVDRYGVRYTELISPLIKAIQELYGEIKGLVARVLNVETKTSFNERAIASNKAESDLNAAKLEKENSYLKERTTKLETENAKKDNQIAALKKYNDEVNARLVKIEKMLMKSTKE